MENKHKLGQYIHRKVAFLDIATVVDHRHPD